MTSPKEKGEKLSEVLAELKREYHTQFPKKIQKLKDVLAGGNWLDLAEEFHKLKGTGKTYGFPEVSTLSECLEIHCRGENVQVETVEHSLRIYDRMYNSWEQGSNYDLSKDLEAQDILMIASTHRQKLQSLRGRK